MMNKLLSIVLSVIMALTGFISPRISIAQEEEFYTIAVIDLVANGISESEARSLSEFLRGQITRAGTSEQFRKKSGFVYKVIERSQMDKILDEMEFQSTGCTDEECAVELGKMLNSERIIIGSVGLVGKTYNINTRIVDVETGTAISVADYMFTGQRDRLLTTGIPNVVSELLFGEKKKSKKIYYIIGGIMLAGGTAAALLGGGGSDGGSASGEGTAIIDIFIPDE